MVGTKLRRLHQNTRISTHSRGALSTGSATARVPTGARLSSYQTGKRLHRRRMMGGQTMGLQRGKHYCVTCGWAAKGKCPQHPASSLYMGSQWRPGKKGKRTRLWDNRVHGSQTTPPPTVRLGGWPSRYRSGQGPFAVPAAPPSGIIALGAVNFSHTVDDGTGTFWRESDPVRRAITERSRKPSREHEMKLPSNELGWPFPMRYP